MNIRSREKRPPAHKRLEGGDKLVLGGAVLTQTASHLDAEAEEDLGKYTIRIVSQSPVRVNQNLTLVSLSLDNAPYHII